MSGETLFAEQLENTANVRLSRAERRVSFDEQRDVKMNAPLLGGFFLNHRQSFGEVRVLTARSIVFSFDDLMQIARFGKRFELSGKFGSPARVVGQFDF